MGYTTEFDGQFYLDKPLKPEHKAYINLFSSTRRMKRDAAKTQLLPDPVREAAGLPVGDEGGFFVGGDGLMGQAEDESVLDSNAPPSGQPGLWCQWVATEDGKHIEWNQVEKFYHYTEWLEYIVANFLKPWGYVLNGMVKWSGESRHDFGLLHVVDNVVTSRKGSISYEGLSQKSAGQDRVLASSKDDPEYDPHYDTCYTVSLRDDEIEIRSLAYFTITVEEIHHVVTLLTLAKLRLEGWELGPK